jgi:BASS family bile acid:Na+ symporter
MDATVVDQIRLNFSPQTLVGLNVVIGLMMLGVALELKPADFKRILISPKAPSIGLAVSPI